jgi:hypothetical protein
MLAAIRPDSWNFPLFLHVLGAMVLVGSLVAAAVTLLLGWRRDAAGWTRLGFRTLLFGALPAYIVMRVGAQWIESKEGFGDDEPAWLGIGYITSDAGALLLLISLVLTGLAARKLRRDTAPADGTSTLGRIGAAIVIVLIAAYVVAIWAMTTKPR